MKDTNVKKMPEHIPFVFTEVEFITDNQSIQIKKKNSKILEINKKSFQAEQNYLSRVRPVKLEKLDSLFQLRLKEKGFNCKTAVSLYDEKERSTIYDIQDATLLHNYMELTDNIMDKKMVNLKGYAKTGLLDYIIWGKNYYIMCLLISGVGLSILVMKKRAVKSIIPLEQKFLPTEQNLQTEPISQLKDQNQQDEMHQQKENQLEVSLLSSRIICLDTRKHTLTYANKTKSLPLKIFGLMYQLSQGKDYFQSYEYLSHTLWTEKENADKKNLEQLVIRLRKELTDIPDITINTIRGSGYQIHSKNNLKIKIE